MPSLLSKIFYTLFIRSQILWLSLVAPISIGLLLTDIVYVLFFWSTTAPVYLFCGFTVQLWLLAESIFYWSYRNHLRRLQSFYPHDLSTVRLQTSAERFEMLRLCVQSIDDFPSFVSRWFLGARFEDVRRDNIKDFIMWAFFNDAYERVTDPEILEEVETMTVQVESWHGVQFAEGRTEGLRCMRLSVDPVEPRHKPLLYYGILWLLSQAFALYFHRVRGFRKYSSFTEQQLLKSWSNTGESNAPAPKFSYWYRPGDSNEEREPIVFFHGIGVGIFGYCFVFKRLIQSNRPMFIVEMPYISSTFFPVFNRISEDIPTMSEMTDGLEWMLVRHGFPVEKSQCTVIGHSFGSTIVAWMLKRKPHLINRAVFIDPVCFMLHLPDVAYNFVYRKPVEWAEWAIWWFASRELYISWTLNRGFHWHLNSLFLHQIPDHCQVDVILGGEDCVVPSAKVIKYLIKSSRTQLFEMDENGVDEHPESQVWNTECGKPIRVLHFPSRNHAEFLFNPKLEEKFVEVMLDQTFVTKDSEACKSTDYLIESGPNYIYGNIVERLYRTLDFLPRDLDSLKLSQKLGASAPFRRRLSLSERSESHAEITAW